MLHVINLVMLFWILKYFLKNLIFYQVDMYRREVPSEEKRQGASEGTYSNMLVVSELELGPV